MRKCHYSRRFGAPDRFEARPKRLKAGATLRRSGEVAQLVEHTAENRGVAGSIPALATSLARLCQGLNGRVWAVALWLHLS